MTHSVTWADLKNFVTARSLSVQYVETSENYFLNAFDGPFELQCTLAKNLNLEEIADFELNFKPTGNAKIDFQKESENAQLVRLKYAPVGWTYQSHCLELTTGLLNSLYSKKPDGTDTGFSTISFLDSNNLPITSGQEDIDANCVKTRVTWTPTHDLEIVSGLISNRDDISNDVRLNVIVAPHLPAQVGGSKVFIQQMNLRYIKGGNSLRTDGRASKTITYDPVYFSNRFQFDFDHPVGNKSTHMIMVEFYKL